jgi:hypothetical protein
MVKVILNELRVAHNLFLFGCLVSRYVKRVFKAYRRTIEVRPILASSCVRPSPFKVLMYTLYGASRVLTPVIPSATGNCVPIMVKLADVTNAETGMYGISSMSQPSRHNPRNIRTKPERSESAFAMSSAAYSPGLSV